MFSKALDTALELSEHNKAQAEPLLRKIFHVAQSTAAVDLEDAELWKFAKALLLYYRYDNFEHEQERLTALKKAYVYAQKTIDAYEQNPKKVWAENFYQALVIHIYILYHHSEDFESIVADVYESIMHDTSGVAQRLAQKIVLCMLYNTIVKVDDAFENFHHNEWIETLCNHIETEHSDLTPQQLIDAEKIRAIVLRRIQ
ncbi:MAG: hypothetical protein LBU90_08015 [Bacteroidales bacterium]|jgi:hypothetical protein|nr:hypothetical protein [Bacteroidales bacterium]